MLLNGLGSKVTKTIVDQLQKQLLYKQIITLILKEEKIQQYHLGRCIVCTNL